jgi:class 3 adenylate cyclase
VGLAVQTAARICFAGHGGQILLSRAAREAVEGSQPVGVGFGALGLYRLQGLPMPEALFQLEAADLPADFPPPRTLAAPAGIRQEG